MKKNVQKQAPSRKIKAASNLAALAAAFMSAVVSAQAASISGTVFFDFNGNGGRDAVSEYGLPQWSIRLDRVSPAGPSQFRNTDINGNFNFGSLAAGTYTLTSVNPSPWLQTHPVGPATYSITLAASDTLIGKDFGCKQPVYVPQIQWQKSFGGLDPDQVGYDGVRQTSDGGYAIAGNSGSTPGGVKTSPNFGDRDAWLVRLDANGDQLWDISLGGSDIDNVQYGFNPTTDGGFILPVVSYSGVSGNKTTPNFGAADYWIVRLNANGDKLWERDFGGSDYDIPVSAMQTRDGGFLVCGASYGGPDGNKTALNYGNSDGWVVRLDANGNKLWDRSYGGTGSDDLRYAVENVDGSFLMCGMSASAPSGNKTSPYYGGYDYWLVKIDSAGNPIWDASFGGSSSETLLGFAPTSDGGAALGGYTASGISGNKTAARWASNPGNFDCWIVRVDANGNKLWDKAYGGSGGQNLHDMKATADGGFVFAAYSNSGISGNRVSPFFGGPYGGWVVKTDANGNHQWDQSFGGSGNTLFRACSVTADGGLLLGGQTSVTDGNVTSLTQYGQEDFWVMKLGPLSCTANPLTLVSAVADCGLGKITVNFSAPVNPTAALQTAHYTVSGGAVSVQAASFGASTLSVVLDVPGLLSGVTYTLSVSGLVDDCGNVIAPNAQLMVTCLGAISGTVFGDLNNNCIKNPAEYYLQNWPVQLLPGPRYVLTDANGYYSFPVPAGSYTVSAAASAHGNWTQTCPSGPYSIALGNGQIIGGRDFAFAPLAARLKTPSDD